MNKNRLPTARQLRAYQVLQELIVKAMARREIQIKTLEGCELGLLDVINKLENKGSR